MIKFMKKRRDTRSYKSENIYEIINISPKKSQIVKN